MVDYDPFSDAILDDPFPVYSRLRAESPVHYLERHDSWALARFEDVWNASADPELFVSPGPSLQTISTAASLEAELADEEVAISSIFGMNPPQHTALRKRLVSNFGPGAVRRLEPRIAAIVDECLEQALARGRCDVIGDLAGQVSVRVACMIIGLPLEDANLLSSIVKRFFDREPGIEGLPPDALVASQELSAYLLDQVHARRRRGLADSDALDAYGSIEIDGSRFEDEDLASHLSILVVGGTETLPKVFAGGVLQLHRHPDQRAALVADPSLIPTAFTEIARYEMPTQFLTRTVGRDLELRGEKLREGQGVLLLYRSANRDEAEFDEPDRFDIQRAAPRILSFGHGTHICLGQHAARLEAKIMYEKLLAAVPDYTVLENEVVRARSEFVAGYHEMPIVFETHR